MYDYTSYDNLIKKIAKHYKHAKVTITIIDISRNTRETIIKNACNNLDVYVITFDPLSELSYTEYSDTYYCTNLEQLFTILKFILKNTKIYVTKIKNDYMDSPEMGSYDALIDNGLIDNFID